MITKASKVLKAINNMNDCVNLNLDIKVLPHEELEKIIEPLADKHIKALALGQTKIQDESVKFFSELGLISFDLGANLLTDLCIEDLKLFKTLKYLHLDENEISCERVKELIDALPALELITLTCNECIADHAKIFTFPQRDNLTVYLNKHLIFGREEKENPYSFKNVVVII
jgi:Leucine-rich repeat (LRR) protein